MRLVGRFSCSTWERVTCDVALQAGNQFHLFSNIENEVQFFAYINFLLQRRIQNSNYSYHQIGKKI